MFGPKLIIIKDVRKEQSQRDFYTRLAKKENFPARSIYKLKEIDERFGLFSESDVVLDLGCSPGSWLLYISQKIGLLGRVVGVDKENPRIELQPNMNFIKDDVLRNEFLSSDTLKQKYDAVVSDLSPHTSGIRAKDAAESFLFCQRALEIGRLCLKRDCSFLCKMLESEKTPLFLKILKEIFKTSVIFRPKATRRASREIYLLAQNLK